MESWTFFVLAVYFFAFFIRLSKEQYAGCVEQSLVGGNNLSINDSSYTASSYFGDNDGDLRYAPYKAKLYGKYGWAARDDDNPDDYLQIDLGTPRVITAVATQGHGGDINNNPLNEYVKKYVLKLGINTDSSNWIREHIFDGNTNTKDVVRRNLRNFITARYIRFIPKEYKNHKTMRVNIYVTSQLQAPPSVTVSLYERSVQLNWNIEQCSATNPITGYVVRVGQNTSRLNDNQTRSYTWTNLKPFTEYNVAVKVITKQGPGVWSKTQKIKTDIAVPSARPIITTIEAVTSESILLIWTKADHDEINGPFKGYRITYTPQGEQNKTVDVGDVATYTLTSLLKYTTYRITMAVMNTKFIGPPSTVRRVRTLEDAPSASPSITTITSETSESILLKWKKPDHDTINGPFKGYRITYTPQGEQNKTVDVGDVTTYNLTSLLKYTTYRITMAVMNTKFIGPPSAEQTTKTMEDVPEAVPCRPKAEAVSSKEIRLEWMKPDQNKINGQLKGYKIAYTPQGGQTKTADVHGDVTTYNLTPLLKYTTYNITIAVMNTKHIGPPSTELRVRTLEDAPSAPVNLESTLTPARGLARPQVVIKWDPPCDRNGIIRKYFIEYYYNMDTPKKRKMVTVNKTSSLEYTVIIISSGTFSYTISASTIIEGPYATAKSLTIPEYRCPERSLVGGNSLHIPNTSYTASSQFDHRHVPYNAKLNGEYGWAPRVNSNPNDYLQIDLGTPRVITAVATQGSGGNEEWVTKYKLDYGHSTSKWFGYNDGIELIGNINSDSVVRQDLEYPIVARYIRFVPTAYYKHKTMRVNVYVAIQHAPRITSIFPRKRSIELHWTIKTCTPTHLITGYVIKFANKTGTYNVTSSGPATVFNVTNLKPYTEYNVSVKAIKQVGYGVWSNTSTTRTTIAEPEVYPVITDIAARSLQSIFVSWKLEHAELVHGPLKGYKITYTPQRYRAQAETTNVGDVTKKTLTPLLKYTTYSVTIAVMNTKYTGPPSKERKKRTLVAAPDTSPIITTIEPKTSESILLIWKKADQDKINGPFKGYKITFTQQGPQQTKTVDVGDVLTYTLTSLLKYTTYSITIAVMNTKYIGPQSTELRVRTLEDAPSAPVNISGTLIPAQGSLEPRVNITWDRPRDLNGIIRKYTIVYYYNMDTSNKIIVTINSTSDLKYTINVTENGVLSYKISATTIKEGPYQNGKNITLPSRGKSQKHSQGMSLESGSVAGLVVGFILVLLFLALAFSIWRRKCKQKWQMAEPLPLRYMDDTHSSLANDNYETVAESTTSELVVIPETERPREIKRPSFRLASVKPIKRSVEFPAPDTNKLKQEFKNIPVEPIHDCKEATKPSNKVKNRYKNIVAYDHSLVTLEWVYGETESFYINASYIHGYDGTPEVYIATQGPLENTLNDFWRMIWEQKISSIIMLTNLLELRKVKCHQYWPENCDKYLDITVTNHKTEVFADFVIRTFFLSKAGSPNRRIRQFHFTAWPDKGVPDHATAVLGFRRKVLAMSFNDDSPVVVHCSAGVGRTGTYIMIDAMLRQAEDQRRVDIPSYLQTIRNDRPHMVQNIEQYIFVNMAVHEALTCGNTEVPVQNMTYALQQLSAVDKRHRLTGYALEFQRLENVTFEDIHNGNFDIGLSRENAKKNRYSNSVPANSSRVVLGTEDTTDTGDYVNSSVVEAYKGRKGDYINASFVDTYRERNAFIMTQAPMENTIADFWRMVMHYKIGTIVMLNNLQEEDEAFPQYWPLHGTKTYDGIDVRLLETKHCTGNTVLRMLEVSSQEKKRTVSHFQHLTWENKCIPTNPQSVLDLLTKVQKSQQKSGNSPIIVQCSNGVGRSGTFCAIASSLERVKQEQVLDVFQTVKSIRVDRPGAVETLTQYVFCYNIIQKYLDSFRDYANFCDV